MPALFKSGFQSFSHQFVSRAPKAETFSASSVTDVTQRVPQTPSPAVECPAGGKIKFQDQNDNEPQKNEFKHDRE